MIYIRKIQRVNRSLTLVIPKLCVDFLEADVGSLVVVKRVMMNDKRFVTIELLKTERMEDYDDERK
jgi:hypothetical protein